MPGVPPSDNNPADSNGPYRDWCHDLDHLQDIGQTILSEWQDEHPNHPRDYPTAKWLAENGYSHLRWILNTKHDMGIVEFFIFLTSAGGEDSFGWETDDVATIERLEAYLDDQAACRDWADSTKNTQRYLLNTVLRTFKQEVGRADWVPLANQPSKQTELYENFKTVIKRIREVHGQGESGHAHMRAAHRFFEWLYRANRVEFDPMDRIEEEFRWELTSDSSRLRDDDLRKLWYAADCPEEYVLILGYVVWGLRTQELPRVHIDQIHFDPEDSHIEFSERKNGPGTVALIVGLDRLAEYLDKLQKSPDWNGCLFPSPEEGNEFLTDEQMRNRFKCLCDRADITVEGETPTPRDGRAYYFNLLSNAQTSLLKHANEFIDEQGSKDPETVLDHYLTEDTRRGYRRQYFRLHLRKILPKDAFLEGDNPDDLQGNLNDFGDRS